MSTGQPSHIVENNIHVSFYDWKVDW
jgi:hypothetical protein